MMNAVEKRCRATLVRTDVSDKYIAPIIRVTRIGELGITLTITNNRSTLLLIFLHKVLQLLVTANVVPSSPIVVTLMMETIRSSVTSVLTTATRRNIPEDGILQSHGREYLRTYIALTGWTL
jgi:hypothetical protein